mmetsp:Transcript_21045/g.63327  ORF Transcript_21045/g.63327 Transcript_21045/m.63327 type:complete len:679 (+) Transcript_21045:189-2225(+)|eukprot:CAMPEP_0206144928 /NCGR_PEP_ID=MMETSP1473-20131121/25906_1 /ASSEMBLY_ACC=CAM_ASM_001109 /TAXON_ID=1461547 /ORGANISM="Stichococcus sp, Strain RCC1054" /LENGTH=678 /DNA_ID=CAMNT_0053540955 /DNA_START=145 /DNA_END=2184 /DNA_ORIENTATION=+
MASLPHQSAGGLRRAGGYWMHQDSASWRKGLHVSPRPAMQYVSAPSHERQPRRRLLTSPPCAAGDAQRPSGGDDLKAQRANLDRLFYSSPDIRGVESASEAAGEVPTGPGALPDLPLWRVQWASLPGTQEVLHVHVPHYLHMFDQIMAGPRPWRFGHVYLPGGSEALGKPEAQIIPSQPGQSIASDSGSALPRSSGPGAGRASAPTVGTIMELVAAVKSTDGLIVLAYGVGRMQVERLTQEVPYSRGHCRQLVDAEEGAAAEALAAHVVGDAPPEADLTAVMSATTAATAAAAVAATEVWQQWEVAGVLSHGSGVCGFSQDPQGFAALRFIEGADTIVPVADSAAMSQGGDVQGLGSVSVAAAEAAHKAASEAAATAWSAAGASSPDVQDMFNVRTLRGSTAERGIPSQGAGAEIEREAAEAAARRGNDSDEYATVLEAEVAVWAELDTVVSIASKLNLPRSLVLSRGLLSLRPSPGATPPALRPEGGSNPGEVAATVAAKQLPPSPYGPATFDSQLFKDPSTVVSSSSDAAPVYLRQSSQTSSPQSPVASSNAPDTSSDAAASPSNTAGTKGDSASTEDSANSSREGTGVGGSSCSNRGNEEVGCCPEEYPALRRAQRMSYAMPYIFNDISPSEDRQGLLEAGSITARLRLIHSKLRKHRTVLATLASISSLKFRKE